MADHLPPELDVAIVGAGISGLVLARLLAGAGLSVAVLEQDYSIPRNGRFAGLVTSDGLRAAGIDEVESLPVVEITTVNADVPGWRVDSRELAAGSVFSVIHGDLLEALRRGCRERGVPVVPDATVTGLRWHGAAVAGVVVGSRHHEIRCALVVLADESDPRLAEAPGLRPDWPPTRLMHLGKERYTGAAEEIARRFGVESGGMKSVHITWTTAWGDPVDAYVVPAWGAVTVGVNLLLEDEMASAHHVLEARDELKTFPEIERLLSGLELSDVVTEVVPRGRGSDPPRFVGDGILLVGDVVGATNPLNRDGLSANVAVCASAARVIRGALATGDVSAVALSPYQEYLNETIFRAKRTRFGRDAGIPPGALIPGEEVTPEPESETLRGWNRRSLTGVVGTLRRAAGRRSNSS